MAQQNSYLQKTVERLKAQWPENRAVNIVCHGHSVPAGYFATPVVDTFHAYPHLLHHILKDRFPFAVINVIVTAIGGETSQSGAARFEGEVLCHRPDVLTIDYSLNDRGLGLEKAEEYWREMIETTLAKQIKVLLLTPSADSTQRRDASEEERLPLQQHAAQVRRLAQEYDVGLVDSLAVFEKYRDENALADLMSWSNHPNAEGHALIAREISRWFGYF